jgi:hypothetical protein
MDLAGCGEHRLRPQQIEQRQARIEQHADFGQSLLVHHAETLFGLDRLRLIGNCLAHNAQRARQHNRGAELPTIQFAHFRSPNQSGQMDSPLGKAPSLTLKLLDIAIGRNDNDPTVSAIIKKQRQLRSSGAQR